MNEIKNKINISFVIPVFNGEKTIKTTIESILLQLNNNDEIIVVNDGSSDNTKKILESNDWLNVKVINQPNKGVSAARNKGLTSATGDIVVFFDCDDTIDNSIVDKVRRVFSNNKDVKWCFGYYIIKNSEETKTIKHQDLQEGIYNSVFELYKTFKLSMTNELLSTCALFFRRDTFKNCGGFDESMVSGEDTFTWLKFGLSYPEIYYLDSNTFTYNRGSDKIERAIHIKRSKSEPDRIIKAINLIKNSTLSNLNALNVVKIWLFRHFKLSVRQLNFNHIALLIKIYFLIFKLRRF